MFFRRMLESLKLSDGNKSKAVKAVICDPTLTTCRIPELSNSDYEPLSPHEIKST